MVDKSASSLPRLKKGGIRACASMHCQIVTLACCARSRLWITHAEEGKIRTHPANHKMQNLWDACLRRLEQELPAQQFNTWIRPLAPESAADDTLVLTAPNRFVLELVRERFASRIERLAAETSGRECGLKLVLARGADPSLRLPAAPQREAGQAPSALERARLNRGFT